MPKTKTKKKTKSREKTFCPYEYKMVDYKTLGFRMICASCKQRID